MPELPEVETVRRGLDRALKDAVIQNVSLKRKDLRVPFSKGMAGALAGRRIVGIDRRAKYLLFRFDSEDVLIAHLGMSGRFSVTKTMPALTKHDHAVFELADGRALIFNDPRRFGVMLLVKAAALDSHPLLAELGPEPLGKGFSADYLKKSLSGRKTSIKAALMDQHLVAGVGNIYASEALFRAGIDPRKSACKTAGKATDIIASVQQVLEDAIASGGSSLKDFFQVSGESGYFQHRFHVYGREGKPCLSCHAPIRILRQAGRSTFFCPACQK